MDLFSVIEFVCILVSLCKIEAGCSGLLFGLEFDVFEVANPGRIPPSHVRTSLTKTPPRISYQKNPLRQNFSVLNRVFYLFSSFADFMYD